MRIGEMIGQRLGSLAPRTHLRQKGYCVYILRNAEDDTGLRIADDFTIRGILRQQPGISDCVVKYAEEYYGQVVLRVIWPEGF